MSENNEGNNPEPEIVENLPDELKKLAEEKGISQELLARLVSVSITSSWRAPYPPPEIFNKYPPAIRKIIAKNSTSQMLHRQKIEKKVIDSNIRNGSKGMTYAFLLTIAMIVAGVILIILDKSTAGLIAIFGPTAFQGGNFLFQKWREWRKIGKDAEEESNRDIEGKV